MGRKWRERKPGIKAYGFLRPVALQSNSPALPFCTLGGSDRNADRITDVKRWKGKMECI